MELVKTELVSSQKGCYVKQHISKFGLIQNLDKMKYYKSPVCVYFTHVRHQMRKNCYVWDTKCSPWTWAERRYIFSATNYYVGHKFGPRYIFSVPRGTDVSSYGCQDPLKFHSFMGDTINPEKQFLKFCINCLRGWRYGGQQARWEEEDKYKLTALEPTVILESRRFIQHKHQVYVPCAGLLLFSYCLIRHQMAFCCDKLTLCWHKQQFNIKSISTVLATRVHQSQIKKGKKRQTMIVKSIVPGRYLSWYPPASQISWLFGSCRIIFLFLIL